MVEGLVKLVQTTIATITLSAILSCNPLHGPSYSNTPVISNQDAEIIEPVVSPSSDSYEFFQKQTTQSDPCQHLSFMECVGYGIGETSKYIGRFSP